MIDDNKKYYSAPNKQLKDEGYFKNLSNIPISKSPHILCAGYEECKNGRNRLKGLAIQKLLARYLPIDNDDIRIKDFLFKLEGIKNQKFFRVKKPFKIGNNVFSEKYDIFTENSIPQNTPIFIREKAISRFWSKCNHCGQYYPTQKLNKIKCYKCNKGKFKIIRKEYENWTFISQKFQWLLDYNYVTEIKAEGKPDFLFFENNVLHIVDSKNKEVSGLQIGDILAILKYAFKFRELGYKGEEIVILHNGEVSSDINDFYSSKHWIDKHGFKFKFGQIMDFLKSHNNHVSSIIVTKKNKEKYSYEYLELKDTIPEGIIIQICEVTNEGIHPTAEAVGISPMII